MEIQPRNYFFSLSVRNLVVHFPKSTYMYWQKRFDRVNPNEEIKKKIIEIHSNHKDYGYRRVYGLLCREGYAVNKKITTNTTEFKYYEIDNKGRMIIKKLYLEPFLDVFNGEVLSYGISKTPSAVSVLSAQKQAIEITSACPYRRTFHSDRGWAYQMTAYSQMLKENKIFQSVSRK